MKEIPYVLKKHGLFYAHNSSGYVSSVFLAELYDEQYAKNSAEQCDEVTAIPVTVLMSDPEVVQEYIDRLEAMRDALIDSQE